LIFVDFFRLLYVVVRCVLWLLVLSDGNMHSLRAVITHSTKAVVDGDSEGQRIM